MGFCCLRVGDVCRYALMCCGVSYHTGLHSTTGEDVPCSFTPCCRMPWHGLHGMHMAYNSLLHQESQSVEAHLKEPHCLSWVQPADTVAEPKRLVHMPFKALHLACVVPGADFAVTVAWFRT